jgi:hypothetical protein
MIRRGFWLLVGAAGGIMGYRRVSSLGRQLSGTLLPGPRGGGAERPEQPDGAETPNDTRRNGNSLNGNSLNGSAPHRKALSRKARRGLVRGTIRFTRDARMFGRDVREGMDLYLVRRTARVSPRLGSGAESRRSQAPPFIEARGANTDNDERVKDDR